MRESNRAVAKHREKVSFRNQRKADDLLLVFSIWSWAVCKSPPLFLYAIDGKQIPFIQERSNSFLCSVAAFYGQSLAEISTVRSGRFVLISTD